MKMNKLLGFTNDIKRMFPLYRVQLKKKYFKTNTKILINIRIHF